MTADSVRAADFHCHVDLLPAPAVTIAACETARILTLAVTTTPKAWSQNRKWTTGKRFVHPAVGLHPELVAERHGEVALLEQLMAETRFVGEVGLDGSPRHRASLAAQGKVFTRVLRRAQYLGGRVISIHSRRAAKDVVECLTANCSPDRVLAILHWFSDSATVAEQAVRAGCYFSINHCMLESASGRALVRSLPANRVLTETDAPFARIANRAAQPGDVVDTEALLAAALSLTPSDMSARLKESATEVMAFAGVHYT
jgi:TatD DNase family protein